MKEHYTYVVQMKYDCVSVSERFSLYVLNIDDRLPPPKTSFLSVKMKTLSGMEINTAHSTKKICL